MLDNVKVGLHNQMHTLFYADGILRLPSYHKVEKEMNERAMELLKVFDLEEEADYTGIQSSLRKAEKAGDRQSTGNRAEASAAG